MTCFSPSTALWSKSPGGTPPEASGGSCAGLAQGVKIRG